MGALFLDLKKAFDTLDHNILLQKLNAYGIRGIANNVIRSYLVGRKQFVCIDDSNSTLENIAVGVPQGSNIGPLLFLLYINDLFKLPLHGTPRLFADDTSLFYPGKCPNIIIEQMEHDLEVLSKYFNNNLLTLNFSKTKYMIFHSPRKKVAIHSDPMLRNNVIEKVNKFKYLGILLDETLSWNSHIQSLERKLSSYSGVLWRVRSFIPRHALIKFYYAFIHSQLNYLIAVWGRASISFLRRLQVLQNRCLKIIFKLPIRYSTYDLYSVSSHNILPLAELCDMQTVLFMYDNLRSNNTRNLRFSTGVRTHNTRQSYYLQRSRASTSFGQRRISFIGPTKYNNLPEEVRNLANRSTFKTKLVQHLKLNLNQ